jgi:hypothetical protein
LRNHIHFGEFIHLTINNFIHIMFRVSDSELGAGAGAEA